MRKLLIAIVVAGAAALSPIAVAQSDKGHSAQEIKEDVTRHRHMAAVHEAAAKCLEAGKSEKACHEQLRKDCKGVGIGRYCGMRHKH